MFNICLFFPRDSHQVQCVFYFVGRGVPTGGWVGGEVLEAVGTPQLERCDFVVSTCLEKNHVHRLEESGSDDLDPRLGPALPKLWFSPYCCHPEIFEILQG